MSIQGLSYYKSSFYANNVVQARFNSQDVRLGNQQTLINAPMLVHEIEFAAATIEQAKERHDQNIASTRNQNYQFHYANLSTPVRYSDGQTIWLPVN